MEQALLSIVLIWKNVRNWNFLIGKWYCKNVEFGDFLNGNVFRVGRCGDRCVAVIGVDFLKVGMRPEALLR